MNVCMNIPQVEDYKCLAKNNFVGPLCQVKLSGYACSAYKSKINVLCLYLFCRQCGEHDLANKFTADITTHNINA